MDKPEKESVKRIRRKATSSKRTGHLSAITLLMMTVFWVIWGNVCLSAARDDGDNPPGYVDASSDNFPPMNLLNAKGQLTGFGPELADAVIRAIGGNITHIHSSNWVEVIEWLNTGKADFIHDTGYTKGRDEFLDYSEPIIEMPEVIFVRPDQYDISDLDSLEGKTVACVNKHITHLYLQDFPKINCHEVDTPVAGLYELISGNVDAFIYPKQIVLYLMQNLRLTDKIKMTGEPLRTLTWSMVVKEGNGELLARLNRGIAKVRESGEYDRIYNKWWGKKILSGYSERELQWITGVTSGSLLLVALTVALFFFNRRLSKGKKDLELQIIERKKAEEALRDSEARHRKILENVLLGVYQVTLDGKFLFANQKMTEVFGYSSYEELEAIGGIAKLYARPVERKKIVDEIIHEGVINQEIEFRRKDGESIWVKAHTRKTENKEGTIILEGIIEDVTEIKKLENQLQQSHKMEAIGTLAGGIAHEFNNILGVILGHAELALDDVPNGNPAKESLREILSASLRAKEVVGQILSFARKTMTDLKPVEITKIIREFFKLMRATIPTTIEVRSNLPDEPQIISGDPTEIHQILMNLYSNAAHAMKEAGGILEVGISAVSLDKDSAAPYEEIDPGDFVKLTLKDSGRGIPPETLKNIFDPYFTTKDVGEGTGMGLAVVYGLVKKCKGAINVRSEIGKGTLVEVLFPKIEEEAVSTGRKKKGPPTGKERILLVDDEGSMVELTRQVLERLGYSVVGMTDSIAALERFSSNSHGFDLVITDMAMPHMAGDKFAARLLKIRQDIPILLCTGHSDSIDEERAKIMGIKGFLMKPFDKDGLAGAVRMLLDQ